MFIAAGDFGGPVGRQFWLSLKLPPYLLAWLASDRGQLQKLMALIHLDMGGGPRDRPWHCAGGDPGWEGHVFMGQSHTAKGWPFQSLQTTRWALT